MFCYILDKIPNPDNMTDEDIQVFMTLLYNTSPGDVQNSLSGLVFNSSGFLVRARAVMHIWLLADTSTNGEEKKAMEWELGFIDTVVDNPPPGKPDALLMYGLAERSYDDEIKFVVSSNFATLLMGFVLLFVYIFVVLGNFNWIEQRAFLSIAGMLVIGLALGSCYGLGFYLRVSFNDMCPVIPFLLLGNTDNSKIICNTSPKVSVLTTCLSSFSPWTT